MNEVNERECLRDILFFCFREICTPIYERKVKIYEENLSLWNIEH